MLIANDPCQQKEDNWDLPISMQEDVKAAHQDDQREHRESEIW